MIGNEIINRAATLCQAYIDMRKNNYGKLLSESTVYYDEAECDSKCLADDMQILLDDIEMYNNKDKIDYPDMGDIVYVVEVHTNLYHSPKDRSAFCRTAIQCRTLSVDKHSTANPFRFIYRHRTAKMFKRKYSQSMASKFSRSVFATEAEAYDYYNKLI